VLPGVIERTEGRLVCYLMPLLTGGTSAATAFHYDLFLAAANIEPRQWLLWLSRILHRSIPVSLADFSGNETEKVREGAKLCIQLSVVTLI